MQNEIPKWMRAAAIVLWLIAGIPSIHALIIENGEAGPGWLVGYLAFGVLLLAITNPTGQLARSEFGVRLLAIVLALSLTAMLISGGCHSTGLLLALSAWQLGMYFPIMVALAAIGIQTTLAVVFFCPPLGFDQGVFTVSTMLGAQLLGAFAVTIARRERASREALERANNRLVATQALLAERAMLAERNRISGELHDAVGHSLTALSIQLEVASHLAAGPALDHVRQSQTLAKSLLSEVREVVGHLRGVSTLSFTEALQQLVARVPALAIRCAVNDAARDLPEPQRSVLLRCVQEAITNTLRHAQAHTLDITVEHAPDRTLLRTADDGVGAETIRFGHGLELLNERVRSLGGAVAIRSAPGRGFEITAHIPNPA
jgi:signal transduction histidine kinase